MAITDIPRTIMTSNAVAARLSTDRLRRDAEQATGLSTWGDSPFEDALERLCKSATDDAQLYEQGLESFAARIHDALVKRLIIYADRANYPEIAKQEIKAPLIVTGLPRSGTTILHALLAQDPAVRSPQRWEVEKPSPPPRAESYRTDPRIAESQAIVDRLPATFKAMHAMGATLPEECNNLMTASFLTPNFMAMARVSSYLKWLVNEADMAPAFAFHRHFLQHLQAFAPGAYWVLKAPPHIWWIKDLFKAYPDARLVITHRDPAETIPSNASLISFLCSSHGPVDPIGVGEEQLGIWYAGVERMLDFRASGEHAEQIVDTHYASFVKDPVTVARSVYTRFGIPLSEGAEAGMAAFMGSNKQDKHGKHEYTAEGFGYDVDKLHAQFARYLDTFGVAVRS